MPLSLTQFNFFIFLALSLAVYWSFKRKKNIQNLILLISSYFFYGYGSIIFAIILFCITLINYTLSIFLSKSQLSKKKLVLWTSHGINIVFLIILKYFNFFSNSVREILILLGLNLSPFLIDVILPIGISFYILQLISYNVEVYRGELMVLKNFIDFSLFTSFFPKILSGPIEKPQIFLPKISKDKEIGYEAVFQSVKLIILGYFKKIVISDLISFYIHDFYLHPLNYNPADSFFIVWLFSIQIYADFSGYTDIVRGISKLFGYELTINFTQPYFSKNIQSFWRRWHISLSVWMRDYVYIPLGGNKKGQKRIYANLLITMLIVGIWHGVGLNFIIWGLMHGIGLVFHRFFSFYSNKQKGERENSRFTNATKIILSWILTNIFVGFVWIFFRSPSLDSAFTIIRNLFTFNGFTNFNFLRNTYFLLWIFSISILIVLDIFKNKVKFINKLNKNPLLLQGLSYSLMLFLTIMFQFTSYPPFIYEGF